MESTHVNSKRKILTSVHRLELGLYSHPKEFWGNGVRTHVNSKGKIITRMHRLELGLYSHPKEFWGNGTRTHVNSKGKILTSVHRLDLGLYSHPKEFGENGVKTHVNSKGAQSRVEPTTLHHAGQWAQHTTDWAVPTPYCKGYHAAAESSCWLIISVGVVVVCWLLNVPATG